MDWKMRKGPGFEIYVKGSRVSDSAEVLYSVFIPDSYLDPHRQFSPEYFSPHIHPASGGSGRFRDTEARLLCTSPDFLRDSYAVIDSKIYALSFGNQLYALDMEESPRDISWEPVASPILCMKNDVRDPTLVSYGDGRLCLQGVSLLGSEDSSFKLVFNPKNNSWIELDELVVSEDTKAEYVISSQFDVRGVKECLECIPGFSFSDFLQWFVPSDILARRVTVQFEQGTVFWISAFPRFCSYNIRTKEFRSGPIIGLGDDDILELIMENEISLPLLHLEGDLFCLAHTLNNGDSTGVHCFVCRIVKPEVFGHFALMVVGCFCGHTKEMTDVDDVFVVAR